MTLEEVEARIFEAISTLAALPDRERQWLYRNRVAWPAMLREAVDVMGEALERLAHGKTAHELPRTGRAAPDPAAIDRMDEALTWLTWMSERDRKIVTLRSYGISWVRISWRFGKSDTTVQRWHKDALRGVLLRLTLEGAAVAS